MSVLNVELFESLDFLSVTRYCEITQGDHQASFGQGAQNAMKTFNYRAITSSVMDTSAPCFSVVKHLFKTTMHFKMSS